MAEDLVRMIYGDDATSLFNGQMFILYDGEADNRYGLIHKCTGKLITDMKIKHIAPLIYGEEIKGYILIATELHSKIYNSFYKITPINGMITRKNIEKISAIPVYTTAAILTESGEIVIGKCLITPSTPFHPSITLKYNKKSYVGTFSKSQDLLEYMSMVT